MHLCNVQRLCEKVFSLLWVILGLQRIIQDLIWTDAYPISWICHLVDFRVCIIYTPVFYPLWGAAHENEVLFILYRSIQDLPAIFQSLPKKRLFVVSGS